MHRSGIPQFADNKTLATWALWGPTHTREFRAATELILLTGCRQYNYSGWTAPAFATMANTDFARGIWLTRASNQKQKGP